MKLVASLNWTERLNTDPCAAVAGFLADSLFLTLLKWMGPYCFLLFAGIAYTGGMYSWMYVPETTGRTLAEVQALLKGQQGQPVQSGEAELSIQAPHLLAAGTEITS